MTDNASAASLPPITLVWLESVRSGTASELHLRGTMERLRDRGCTVQEVIASSTGAGTSNPERVRRLGALLVKAVRARHDGILLARFHPLLLPVLWWWQRAGSTVVLSVQGALDPDDLDGVPFAKWWIRLGQVTLRRADGVVTVTPGLADALRPNLRAVTTPVAVIPNGVDRPIASPTSPPWPYAVFVGNLAAWQGVEQMLAATRDPVWPDGLRLVVVGDGTQAERVRSASSDIVIPKGRLPREEAMAWLAGAVFAFALKDPSSGAGSGGYWPFKVLESAAYGVPAITSEAEGLTQMADELGSAIVCRYDDVPGIAAAAARLHTDATLRASMSQAGRKNVLPHLWTGNAQLLVEALAAARRHRLS